MADADVSRWRLARFHAVKEVIHVTDIGLGISNLRQFHVLKQFWRVRDNSSTIDEKAPFFTNKFRPLVGAFRVEFLSARHHDAIGIGVFDIGSVGCFVPTIGIIDSRTFDARRAALVHPKSPLGDVEMMRTEVRLLSTAVIPIEAEEIVKVILVVRAHRSWA